jgi:hypothetical protein
MVGVSLNRRFQSLRALLAYASKGNYTPSPKPRMAAAVEALRFGFGLGKHSPTIATTIPGIGEVKERCFPQGDYR